MRTVKGISRILARGLTTLYVGAVVLLLGFKALILDGITENDISTIIIWGLIVAMINVMNLLVKEIASISRRK